MVTKHYKFVPYDKTWPEKFKELKAMLLNIFRDKALAIEHIGSTSVPGMDAKPLIDILVIVKNAEDITNEKNKLISFGYIARENVLEPRSFLFEKVIHEQKVENIHVFEANTPSVSQFINVRDYLRVHPERAQEYIQLKHSLKKQFPDDYQAYRKGKRDFLNETERLGKEMKGL